LGELTTDQAGFLQRMRGERYGRPAHAKHHRKKLLGQGQRIILIAITRVQQPSSQTRLKTVDGITSGRLLQVGRHDVIGACGQMSDRQAFARRVVEFFDIHPQRMSRQLNDRFGESELRLEPDFGADGALAADGCDLDGLPVFKVATKDTIPSSGK
jgi:hypothetical protein